VELRHAPVVEHFAPTHGVSEVNFPVVFFIDVPHGSGNATFGHNSVCFAKQRLADQRNAKTSFFGFDGSAHPSATRTDNDDVIVVMFKSCHGVYSFVLKDFEVSDRSTGH
jgi:hypothetical protein